MYYEVYVGDMQFHGQGALTYSWPEALAPGQVVRIALRERSVLGIVVQKVPRPKFATKSIAAVANAPALPPQSLRLLTWLAAYYPAPLGTIVRQFLPPTTAFAKKITPVEPTDTRRMQPSLPNLTTQQSAVLGAISAPGSYLLRGITGSGKTRVYTELAAQTLRSGKSAVVLTPEIGLTAPLIQAFQSLGAPVHVLHSHQTAATRRDAWFAILGSTDPIIVIGPRSALFAPVHNIGLIIMDEAHDQAYKSDQAPRYRTDRVAGMLAQFHQAVFVRGTATPNVEDIYIAKHKNTPIMLMDKKAKQSDTTNDIFRLVDMRDKTNFGRSRILTAPLLTAVSQALDKGEQSLLFLNRRGTAASILCPDCGWRAVCPHCDLPLTYHGDTHQLRCHVCGRTRPPYPSCPECGQSDIVFKSIGTKAVIDEVQRLFPTARLKRFDMDVDKPDRIEAQLDALSTGKVDIIVGTQMITKGLDLPGLAVVGVLNADSSLLVPDYSASERTYQLIAQVVGRVGRGHRASTVILQTYTPDHPVLQQALIQDWDSFYANELSERQQYRFPPYVFLLKLWCFRASSRSAETAAAKLLTELQHTHPRLSIEGPAPAFHPRENGKYKWQLVIKSPSRTLLVDIVKNLPSGWNHDLDPTNLL